MTTYTKETALYDTGAIGNGIDAAGKTADKYITAVDSNGVKVHAENNLNSNYSLINANGMTVYKGGDDVASFGSSSRVGKEASAHTNIDANGMRVYASDGTTQLANIGYGLGTAQSGEDIAPYYTFGTRLSATSPVNPSTPTGYSSSSTYDLGDRVFYNNVEYVCIVEISTPEAWTSSHWSALIGNYSSASGFNVTASGFASHAEGSTSLSGGNWTHAEGGGTIALGIGAHAEGEGTKADGMGAHAEGWETKAIGTASHASGTRTIASKANQTVIGAYNIEDTSTENNKLFIIGNGTWNNARSNAFEVYKNGNVTASGSITAGGFPSGLTTELHSVSTGSVSSTSDSGAKTATVTKTGYYPLAVSGWYFAGTNLMYQTLYSCRLSSRSNGSATITYRFYNRSSAAYNGTFYFEILWAKL